MKNITLLRIVAALALLCVALVTFTSGPAAGAVCFVAGGLGVEAMRAPLNGHRLYVYTGATLAELFIPEIYADIETKNSLETNAFAASGVAATNTILQVAAQSGTKKVEVPYWNDIDPSSEPNYSDETDDDSVPGKVDTDSFDARNSYMNKSYGETDLVKELSRTTPGDTSGPMGRIKERFAFYWTGVFQRRILAIARGIQLSNIANNSSDMIHSVAQETTVGLTDANKISADAVQAAVFTMGDRFNDMRVIAMHSVPYAKLVNQQMIEYIRDAEGTLMYTSYLGLRIVIDDSMPVRAGTTSGLIYTTMIFGEGVIGYGIGSPPKPAEVYREATKGKGAGREAIIERRTWMIHPQGMNWTDTTVTAPAMSPTLANLALAANWTRVYDRKAVPLAFLETNG